MKVNGVKLALMGPVKANGDEPDCGHTEECSQCRFTADGADAMAEVLHIIWALTADRPRRGASRAVRRFIHGLVEGILVETAMEEGRSDRCDAAMERLCRRFGIEDGYGEKGADVDRAEKLARSFMRR